MEENRKAKRREELTRRRFLGISTAATAGGIVAGLAIGGVAGYAASQSLASNAPQAVTRTTTQTVTATPTTTSTAKEKITAGIIGITADAPFYMALEKGLFAREGLEVESKTVAGSGTAVEAVLSGAVDLAQISFTAPMKLADEKGIYLKVVHPAEIHGSYGGQKTDPNLPSVIMVKKGSSIKRLLDLKGKRIATNVLGSANHIAVSLALKKAGLDPTKDVEWKEIPFPSMIQPLSAGQVEAATIVSPFTFFALKQGLGEILIDPPTLPFGNIYLSSLGNPYPVSAFFTSEDTIRKKPDVIKRCTRALAEGVLWLYGARAEAYAAVGKYLKLDTDVLGQALSSVIFVPTPDGFKDYEILRPQMQGYVEFGFLSKQIDITKFQST